MSKPPRSFAEQRPRLIKIGIAIALLLMAAVELWLVNVWFLALISCLVVLICINKAFMTAFHDTIELTNTEAGVQLRADTWRWQGRPHSYEWSSADELLQLRLDPVQLDSPLSVAAVAMMPSKKGVSTEDAVNVGRATILQLIARGDVQVWQRQVFASRSTGTLRLKNATYTLTLARTPADEQLGELEKAMLAAFARQKPGSPVTVRDLVNAVYPSDQSNPERWFVDIARWPARRFDDAQVEQMRAELLALTRALNTHYSLFARVLNKDIGRAIRAHQRSNDN